jgi:hypothetical protein
MTKKISGHARPAPRKAEVAQAAPVVEQPMPGVEQPAPAPVVEPAPAPAPAAKSARKPGAKATLRTLLAEVGAEVEIGHEALATFTRDAVSTAISDLANQRYCGPGGIVKVERIKGADGKLATLKRIG